MAVVMGQSRITYPYGGITASYFIDKFCQALSSEIVIPQCP
jgi:hypothetical protein